MYRLFTRSSFNGSHRFVGEVEKPTHIIATISATNQMVTISKDIDCRLNFDEPTKLIKYKLNDPPIRMKLAWTQLVVSKHFPHESLKREVIPHHICKRGL
jgi:hypothetical protein